MYTLIERDNEIKLVGISVRTKNAIEMNASTAKIEQTMQHFFTSGVQNKIFNRKNVERTFAVYTHYENDENGEYTYFLGKEVTSFENLSKELVSMVIPVQSYLRFTSTPGKMPDVVIDVWKNIWHMNFSEVGYERAYLADFEVYDERAADPNHSVVDVYIGVKK